MKNLKSNTVLITEQYHIDDKNVLYKDGWPIAEVLQLGKINKTTMKMITKDLPKSEAT